MDKTLSIEYHEASRLVFISTQHGDVNIDIRTVSIPEDLDVATEAELLFDLYEEDEAWAEWSLELEPLYDLNEEVLDQND